MARGGNRQYEIRLRRDRGSIVRRCSADLNLVRVRALGYMAKQQKLRPGSQPRAGARAASDLHEERAEMERTIGRNEHRNVLQPSDAAKKDET